MSSERTSMDGRLTPEQLAFLQLLISSAYLDQTRTETHDNTSIETTQFHSTMRVLAARINGQNRNQAAHRGKKLSLNDLGSMTP